jgi:Recombinase
VSTVPKRRPRRRSARTPPHPARATEPRATAASDSVREAARVERLAYTRSQAAAALGISRSTFIRRVLPYVDTIEMPWGAKLIPVDELERLLAEQRRAAKPRPAPATRGRPRLVPPEIIERIRSERAAGKSLHQIAADLNTDQIPTAHGGAKWWPSTIRSALVRPNPATSATDGRGASSSRLIVAHDGSGSRLRCDVLV